MSTHLYVRSAFSLLKGTMSVRHLVEQAKTLGYSSIALSDRLVMHGIPEFLEICRQQGIHPIIGVELDIEIVEQRWPFLFLAKDNRGYQILTKFSSLENTGRQCLNLNDLKGTEAHIFCIALGEGGPFEEALYKHNHALIKEIGEALQHSFPGMMLAVSNQENAFWIEQNQTLKRILNPLGFRNVACPRVLYAQAEDDELFRVVSAIDRQMTLSDPNLATISYRYMLAPEEMTTLYGREELELSDRIAHDCNVIFDTPKAFLPVFETPEGISGEQYLTQLCLQGLAKRLDNKKIPDVYRQRLKNELDVISSMHYEDYFLIVWDFIRFAKKQGIYVGPGRGSAAGSLVSYVLGITHVDPLKYDLLFERFLNPERVSLPDIDTDFPDQRRDEVLQYVLAKYGKEHVAHISTFGTLAAKQVLRDVGRVMEIPVRDLDSLSKTIPSAPKMTLALAYAQSKAFKVLIESDDRYRKLFKIASALEGLPRHISTHAAGIVMSSVELSDVVPLIQIESDMTSTQYTMEYLESLGLIKMDFLGLRNLTIIDEVVQSISAQSPEPLNILKIPMDDAKTLEIVRNVDTVGIFQLESDGMKNLLRQMKVTCFEDIVATIALFRPGPMENIPDYIAAREHPEHISYLHPDLKPILESTSGIMIYQEQIMQVAQKMAGFSLGKADILRKAMSKKNARELDKLKEDFILGCRQNHYSEKLASELFALIQKFANYGFNKSHSVAYAMISYQMAYLKANHPALFYMALLNSVIGSENKTYEYLQEAKAHSVSLLNPSVNASSDRYAIEDGSIRFPLQVVKGVGSVVCREILSQRTLGSFSDYYDCIVRLSTRKVSRANFEALIDAGAMDEFGLSRSTMRASLDDALEYASLVRVERNQQITIDFNLVKPLRMIEVRDIPLEKAEREHKVLGFYLSDHPLVHVKTRLGIRQSILNLQVSSQQQAFICMVRKIRQHRTKTGAMMAFVSVYDEGAEIDCVLMPNIYQAIGDRLKVNALLKVEGLIEKEGSCLVKRIEAVEV